MESAVPFLIVAFMFGLTWLVAIGMYLGREQPPESAVASTLEAVAPDLEKARFLAEPMAEVATPEPELETAVIVQLERYLQEEQSCAARFVAAPSIELLYSRPQPVPAVA